MWVRLKAFKGSTVGLMTVSKANETNQGRGSAEAVEKVSRASVNHKNHKSYAFVNAFYYAVMLDFAGDAKRREGRRIKVQIRVSVDRKCPTPSAQLIISRNRISGNFSFWVFQYGSCTLSM